MDFSLALQSYMGLYEKFGPYLDGLLLLFFRILAFMRTAPLFNRKNIPILIKISLAVYLTIMLSFTVSPHPAGVVNNMDAYPVYMLQILLNVVVGAFIGFIANMILQVINAAGNVLNNQIGLSSAMIMDPSQGSQTMLLETLFSFIAIGVFLYLGGMYWLINALHHSLEVFPLYSVTHDFRTAIDLSYLVHLSSHVLSIGVQMVSPAIVVTMAVDLMLGVVNRTAQQIPVFQLSFALKPSIGLATMWITLTIFMQMVIEHLNYYAKIF
ncbi:MAG: flagellar biosynthetic protein FliR [Cyanobacteria bacterium P01_H01_bin.74]